MKQLTAGKLFFATAFALISFNAIAQVTCSRTGDQIYCNGSLHPSRPATPRVYSNPYGSYQSGYEAGVMAGRARNLANATQMYFDGKIQKPDRDRFLAYIAKYGGDVEWFRNDMAARDQESQPSRSMSPTSVPDRLQQLEALRSQGVITQSEYEAKRKEIINSL